MYKGLILTGIIIFLQASCGLNDYDAPVPAYLILKDPKVSVPNLPGGETHKITDVWVYADGQLQGIFPLPARVPVIANQQESEITILAGIRKNGIQDEPAFYPFYRSISYKIVLEELKEINIPLLFTYAPESTFDIIADFEQVNPFTYDLDNNAATTLDISSETAASGIQCGKAVLNNTKQVIEVATSETFNKLSLISGNAYIEMDYKGDCEIGVGLVTYDDQNPGGLLTYKVVVVPRESWNKIYVDITNELSNTRLKSYKLAFGFTRPLGKTETVAYIDNVKLVRF